VKDAEDLAFRTTIIVTFIYSLIVVYLILRLSSDGSYAAAEVVGIAFLMLASIAVLFFVLWWALLKAFLPGDVTKTVTEAD